jgi:hypothetical protein
VFFLRLKDVRNQYYCVLFVDHFRRCWILYEIRPSCVLWFWSRQLYLCLPRCLDHRRTSFAIYSCIHLAHLPLLVASWMNRPLADETSSYSPSRTWHGASLQLVSASTFQPRATHASASSPSSSSSSPRSIVREKDPCHSPIRLKSSHLRIVNLACLGLSLLVR